MLNKNPNHPQLDRQTITEFQDKGVVVLPGMFAQWVETLRQGIDENRQSPGPDAKNYASEDGKGMFFGDYCNWQRIPQYRDFIFNSRAANIGQQLMESEQVQLFHEHVLVKDASADVATPWHQDQPFYSVQAKKTVSLWIALDPVPLERALSFIPGSHQCGKIYRPERFNGTPLNENDAKPVLPDINADLDNYDICRWAMEPGDAVAFDYKTLHGAPGNDSPASQRRAFSLRLLGENAIFSRSEQIITSPPFSHVNLSDGDRLVGGDFPILIPTPKA